MAATDEDIAEDDNTHRNQTVQEGEEESNSGGDAAKGGPLLDLLDLEDTVKNNEQVDNCSFTFVEKDVN